MYDIIICYNANRTVALVFSNQLNINSIPLVEKLVFQKKEEANVLLLKELKNGTGEFFTQSGQRWLHL